MENDKPTVIALREIAKGLLNKETLENEVSAVRYIEDTNGEATISAPSADL